MISTGKNLFKKFMAMLLIIATVLSYFPIAVFAETGATRGNTQYVKFDAEWAQGGTSITTESGLTNIIDLGLTLSGGPVFNNLNIYVEDITENRNLPNPTIEITAMKDSTVSANGHDLEFKKSISSGYQSEANVNLTFYNTSDFTEYDKTIQITLTGDYKLNNETIEINEVKTFNIHVVPKPVVEQFSSNVKCKLSKDKITTKRYSSERDFEVDSFSLMCEIPVESANETYSRIVLNIDRSSPQNLDKAVINSTTNLKFQILQTAGYTYNIVRELDGTTYIEFTRGTQLNSFDENTVKYNQGTIKVKIEYKVVENTSTSYGSTLVKAAVTADVEGVTTVTSSAGKEYTKGNYHFDTADEMSLNIYSNVPAGNVRSNDYDVWLTGVNYNQDDYLAAIADANFNVVYL